MKDDDLLVANRLALAGELTRGLRHDVNNSCSVVMNNTAFTRSVVDGLMEEVDALEALTRSGGDPAELRLAIQRLQGQLREDGQEMRECFSEVMDAARRIVDLNMVMTGVAQPARPPREPFGEVVTAAVQAAAMWQRKSVEADVHLMPDHPTREPDTLFQLVLNLVLNARQSFERADPNHRVNVRMESDRLVIESNGTPDARVPVPRPGLGLWASRQLAERLGMELRVDLGAETSRVSVGPIAP